MKLDLLKNPTHPPPYWGGSEDNEQQSIINVPSAGLCCSFGDITKSVTLNGIYIYIYIPENNFLRMFITASSPGYTLSFASGE